MFVWLGAWPSYNFCLREDVVGRIYKIISVTPKLVTLCGWNVKRYEHEY